MDGGQFHYPQCCHATLDQMQRIRKSEDMRTSGKVSQFYTYNLLGLLIDLLEESKAKVFFIIVSVNFTFMFTSSTTRHRAILRFRNNIS